MSIYAGRSGKAGLLGSNAAELAASVFAGLFVEGVARFVEGCTCAKQDGTGHEADERTAGCTDGLRTKREVAEALDDVLFWSLGAFCHIFIIPQTLRVVNLRDERVGVY